MCSDIPYQVIYKNQLQFNLAVPLTTKNLAVQFSRPSPIVVERVGGQHGIPSKCIPKQATATGGSVFNYSTLSQEKMEMMSQLAKRDLHNRKLQSQIKNYTSSESQSPATSPTRTRLHQKSSCQRFARQEVTKPRKPLTAKEGDKNRRLGAVQTPPARRPVSHFRGDDSLLSARNTSANMTKDSDVYFPAKPLFPEGSSQSKDELEKLQQEMEGYLLQIEHIGERAISEPGAKFLHLPAKGKQKDEFLLEEEDSERVHARVEEQNIRLTRNLYNLKLKVKQVQRDATHADLNKPSKKSQILSQLGVVGRGAVKALQTFVNQLPYQDLSGGLPSYYHELALLLRQLTALCILAREGKQSAGNNRLLNVLDRIDNMNARWILEKKASSVMETKNKKPAITKDWVSDTKVDRNIFVMKGQPEFKYPLRTSKAASQPSRQQHMQRGRAKKRAVGKENRGNGPAADSGKNSSDLRSAIGALLQGKVKAAGGGMKEHNRNNAWEVEMGRPHSQDHRKGYLLPYDLIAKREKAQRALALADQERRYADQTIATSLKKSPSRPNSAPANVRNKGVNFELDKQSPTPWIPPGKAARSRSLSSEPKSRSRSPFYLRDMDTEDIGNVFVDKNTVKMKKDSIAPIFGLSSPSVDRKLRSADVSNSFIDEVEHRLLRRLVGRVAADSKRTTKDSAPNYRKENISEDTAELTFSDLDAPLDTTDFGEEIARNAASAVDAPTLENMKQRLAEMQREQREIRQRWSSLHFSDMKPSSRIFTSGAVQSERFREPPAIEVTRLSKTEKSRHRDIPVVTEWREEPLIFTKPADASKVSYLHTVDCTKQDDHQPSFLAQIKPHKKLVTLKQTAVERIAADRDRIESYLRKRSHHPSGKFDPWKLVEEISDEILSDCLVDIAAEVEQISDEIANHMYQSEFMVDASQPESPSHIENFESQSHQAMGDGVTKNHEKLFHGESLGAERLPHSLDRAMIGVKSAAFDSGDQLQESDDQLPDQREQLSSHSQHYFRSSEYLSPEKLSPVLSDVEPLLDNMSTLFQFREDIILTEVEGGGEGDVKIEEGGQKDDDYEDDYEDISNKESQMSADNKKHDNEGDDYNDDGSNFDDKWSGDGNDEYEHDDFEDDSDEEKF